MFIKSKLVLILVVSMFSLPVSAYSDGNKALSECQSYLKKARSWEDSVSYAGCLGFIKGSRDTIDLVNYYDNNSAKKAFGFCLPTKVTNGQIARVFIKYLKDNPSKLHSAAIDLLFISLMKSFPCKADEEGWTDA